VRALAEQFGIDEASPLGALHSLIAQDMMPESIGKLYSTLRDARNLIAHSTTQPNEMETAEYERQIAYPKWTLRAFQKATKSSGEDEERKP
jgi:hypothetical protein